ncbi:MAG: mycothiol synthase [Actinomycetota bacterium]|jgi:mycothiol synthase|nr:mycothiol synthase [Actinomycetota bacterium]
MARLEIKRQMGKVDIAAVSELLDVATAVDGHHPLGEHQWLDLVHGNRHGFAGLVAWEPGHDHPVGYAQLTREETAAEHGPTWALEYVVDPHHRMANDGIGETLVATALDIVRHEGGGRVHMWVPKPTAVHDRVAQAVGMARGRELRQLRRALPVHEQATVAVRPFVPGRDEEAWLEVNNRAFSWHPEQGGWDLETLRHREDQAWFDPSGFLLHERDGKLAAFCWTKVHHEHGPGLPHGHDHAHDRDLGEIYVVAVDPSYQRMGLGRQMVLAGLDWLTSRGIRTAMLYVDADNDGALHLYEEMGFTLDHVDRAYVGDVEPAAAGS